MIGIMKNIYARNTTIEKIENLQAQDFVEEHHSQGSAKGTFSKTSVGMFYENELVGVIQLCSPRTPGKKKIYSTEILRLCFKKDYKIIGGASKLVKYCIEKYNPADIFTYQDTTGENTDVYEQCGFNLKSSSRTKQYIIAPGKTLQSANRKNREILSISYAVTRGPDSLLGTKIGEKFHSNGKRKTNLELFIDLGWHIEETTGDKVYEWFNPELSFYTYKITASDSDKYYYGVRSIKIPFEKLTVEDCLKDDYFGSGLRNDPNNKFNNWKKSHKNNLKKEVIQIFKTKAVAYNAEKILVGDLWKTEKLCLNSAPGGLYAGFVKGWREGVTKKECPTHGITKHRGNACYKCFMNKLVNTQACPIHGETKFQGNSCSKCSVDKTFSEKVCEIHGLTKFSGNHCRKCTVLKTVNMKECPIHGLTKHQGDVCNSCNALSSISVKNCPTHGETKFTGDKCRKCISSKNNNMKECSIHGLANYRGSKCMKCSAQKRKHNNNLHDNKAESLCYLCLGVSID